MDAQIHLNFTFKNMYLICLCYLKLVYIYFLLHWFFYIILISAIDRLWAISFKFEEC